MSDRSEPSDRLIHGHRLELSEIPCRPGAAAWNARCLLEGGIGAVLPYLNAELNGADYHRELETLIWTNGGRKYAFRPREIAIAPVEDREEACRLMDDVIGIVNDTWARRADIRPSYSRRHLPGLMEIYKLLPATNCRQCGYSSCMAYAARLREGKAKLSQCPCLSNDACTTLREQFAPG